MNMKEQCEKILSENGVIADIDDFLYAMSDILMFSLEETEKNEPYAYNSIANLKSALQAISVIQYEI